MDKSTERKTRQTENDWTRADIERLIELVKADESLWDSKNCEYKDKTHRENAFRAIGHSLTRSDVECKTKWESLRSQFNGYYGSYTKKNNQSPSGNNEVKWMYFGLMLFLTKPNKRNESSTNSNNENCTGNEIEEKQKRKRHESDNDAEVDVLKGFKQNKKLDSKIEEKNIVAIKNLSLRSTERKKRQIESDWTASNIERLIKLVKADSSLWDQKNRKYKDITHCQNAFRAIGDDLNRSDIECKSKWESLRSQFNGYHGYYTKLKNQSPSDKIDIHWIHFKSMLFLKQKDKGLMHEWSHNSNDENSTHEFENSSFPPTPASIQHIQTRKRLHQSDDDEEQDVLNKVFKIMEKKSDSSQVFADFLADRLRQLPTSIAENLKNKVMRLVLDLSEQQVEAVKAKS